MLGRAIGALNALSPKLQFVVFPSGTKVSKSMSQQLSAASIRKWYSAFSNLLSTQSASRAWTWCEVRPDAIIRFTPNGSTFSLAAHWATYLSLYAHIEGPGANVPFPSTASAYNSLSSTKPPSTPSRDSVSGRLCTPKSAEAVNSST